jgi:uncharacterized protein
MIIGIISDTHDKLQAIDAAVKHFSALGVQQVVHCGDWKSLLTLQYFIESAKQYALPVSAVLGNNDHEVTAMQTIAKGAKNFHLQEGVLEIELGGKKAAIYHGHHAPTLRKLMASTDYAIIFLGHTHKPKVQTVDEKLVINPGSVAFSIPRSKSFEPTVAILDTETMDTQIHTLRLES